MANEIEFKDRVSPEDAANYKCKCAASLSRTILIRFGVLSVVLDGTFTAEIIVRHNLISNSYSRRKRME
jgi:hypothetical protein